MIEVKVHRRWGRLLYRLCGATTVHLEHEICLSVTATCLTCASMLSLYRSSFGSLRDCTYIIITHLWLSRHFLHRLLCTTNVGTSLCRPRFFWTFRNAWIYITCGGQYFDVPAFMEDSSSSHLMMRRPSNMMAPSSFSVMPSSFLSSMNHPPSSSIPSSANLEAFSRSVHCRRPTFLHSWVEDLKMYIVYIPPILFGSISILSVWFVYKYVEVVHSYSLPLHRIPSSSSSSSSSSHGLFGTDDGQSTAMSDDEGILNINAGLSIQMFEAKYGNSLHAARMSRDFVYSMRGMVCVIVIVGTVGSLWMYGRVMPPLPDLVAGYGGVSGKGGSHKGAKAHSPANAEQQPWAENYKSIVTEDRLTLHLKVILLRLVEYMFVCVMLPRSEYACRVTRHCEVEPMFSEVGHPTLIGGLGKSMYHTLRHDAFQGGLIYLTVLVCTCIILVSQMIVLNRSHLALGSYSRQLGWMPKKSNSRKGGNHKHEKTTCDDHGESGGGGCNHTNQTDGIVAKCSTLMEQIVEQVHDVLANELGSLSTSRILAMCASVHISYTIFIVIIWAYYALAGKEWQSFALLYLALFGSSVEIGYLEKGGLASVSDEIKNHMQKEGKVL